MPSIGVVVPGGGTSISLPLGHVSVLSILWLDILLDLGGILPRFGLVFPLPSSIHLVSGLGLLHGGSIPCGFSSSCVW